jgi:dTDP-4-dehydrorhamnose reductase
VSGPLRVLITGASGQVGVDLVDSLRAVLPPGADPTWQPDSHAVREGEFEVTALSHLDLDITRRDDVVEALRNSKPEVVVNLAAYTRVDAAENDVERCTELNATSVGTLSQLCAEAAVHFVTISSDFVFDGAKGAAYVEDDATNPLNVYGRSKRVGELHCSANDSVLRTSWVMGVRAKNVLHLIADRVSRGESVRFVNDQRGTATFSADLARALVSVIRDRPSGIWHFANAGDVTWFDLACSVARHLTGSDELVHAVTTSELIPAPLALRPARSDLNTDKWTANGYQSPRPCSDGLARFLDAR